ncbi:SpoIIE family protein phosphatase [Streptomyces sp. NPDC057072]|uniref:SpoIIE family protein phosphatase n=1 Tax=unclassified Streptomyces TaxID=2593676 RepID=UPI00363088A3
MSGSTAGGYGRDSAAIESTGRNLAEILHGSVCEALHRLDAVAAAVYLLNAGHTELKVGTIVGSPPSFFAFPGHINIDAPFASARALTSVNGAVCDPDPVDAEELGPRPSPYVALAVPVGKGSQRFGTLTVLRLDTHGAYESGDCTALQEVAETLADALADLSASGTAITAGPAPILLPTYEASVDSAGWGLSDFPGSAGISMMYPLRGLSELLNQATAMDHVVRAARHCLMEPFRAKALVLALSREGRFWVLGHSGDSLDMARNLHGAPIDAPSPASQAIHGRPLFFSTGKAWPIPSIGPDGEQVEAHLPLTGGTQAIDLPIAGGSKIIGVCCLSFEGPRNFPPEERAVLGMMAGLLGAAVERVDLGTRHREVAEHLQRILLPAALSELPGLTVTARYRPATSAFQVGGDWYDVIKVSDDRIALVVGDVEGHDLESAAVMGQVRTALTSYATEGHPPATVIDRTGRLLTELGTQLLVTCCVVELDIEAGTAEVALAGHPEPLVLRPDGSRGTLHAPSNLPLGITTRHAYRGREHMLAPGSVLLLYSDGLTDFATGHLSESARSLLGAVSSEASADLEPLADRLIADPDPQQHVDDAVLLLARYEGALEDGAPRTASLYIQRRDLHGVRAARVFVDDHLHSWGFADMSDDLQLMVSEIVTNALIHAGSDVDVRLRAFDDHIRLEVRDSDSNPPVPSPLVLREEENAEAEHGRGMLIVDALAGQWNTSPNGRGKTVFLDQPIPIE